MSNPLNEQLSHALEQLLKQYHLSPAAEKLLPQSRSTVKLSAIEPDLYEKVGNSRVGGYPDLPPAMEWPTEASGKLMTPLAQLNLAEIAPACRQGWLPETGMLYFFCGMDEGAANIEHRIIFVQYPEQLAFRHPGAATILEDIYETSFHPYKAAAVSAVELPNMAYVDYEVIDFEEGSTDRYFELVAEMQGDRITNWGTMFGYPTGQHHDAEEEAALFILADKTTEYDSEKVMKHLMDKLGRSRERAEAEIEDMIMLLEIDSNEQVGYQWLDAGVIHFFIRKEDLLARNFSRTYCSLSSS
ncbi:YwqG family protein [Paenibacillus algorifonticola]|nr:YwqG family protein [Paenibacillus algorifonticola]